MKSLLKSRRAISPVIATVILVAVAITVAVSVAYWMGSISSSYTTHEQIEMPFAYPEYKEDLFNETTGGWKIHIDLKNTGSADACIDNILLNDKPLSAYTNGSIKLFHINDTTTANEIKPLSAISVFVKKGSTEKVIVWLRVDVEGCNHGVTINIKLHSAKGLTYPASVKLP